MRISDWSSDVCSSDLRSSFGLGADASWEVDLFGGISRSVEAARADEAATYYNLANVRTAIIAEVEINYIQARLAQEQLGIARNTLDIQTVNMIIAGWRLQAGPVFSMADESAPHHTPSTATSIPALASCHRCSPHPKPP